MTFNYLLNFAVTRKSDKHRTTEAPYENVHHYEAVNPQKIWEIWGTFSEKIIEVLLKICVVVMKKNGNVKKILETSGNFNSRLFSQVMLVVESVMSSL